MMTTTFVLFALRALILILGGTITYFAYQAYQRTEFEPLRALALGFGVVTLGALLAGGLGLLAGVTPRLVSVLYSAFTVTGFAIIVYSLYIE